MRQEAENAGSRSQEQLIVKAELQVTSASRTAMHQKRYSLRDEFVCRSSLPSTNIRQLLAASCRPLRFFNLGQIGYKFRAHGNQESHGSRAVTSCPIKSKSITRTGWAAAAAAPGALPIKTNRNLQQKCKFHTKAAAIILVMSNEHAF